MAISYRLKQPMSERPDEKEPKVQPKRIVFLSLEGSVTEKKYFALIHKYREQLGINAVVHIETLSRSGDTRSDLQSVMGLLEEYLELRGEGILPKDVQNVLKSVGNSHYSPEQIGQYLNGELQGKDKVELDRALKLAGIDIDYQKFLAERVGEDHNDVFGVVIDRDCGNHEEEALRELQKNCKNRGCYCFLQNPCFEFWLLLHVCDVSIEYRDKLEDIFKNEKCSAQHTYVSLELSKRVRHNKKISEKKFVKYYLPNVDEAIAHAQNFEQTEDGLLKNIGTNLPELFRILREKTENGEAGIE